jgi:hypothetical protein
MVFNIVDSCHEMTPLTPRMRQGDVLPGNFGGRLPETYVRVILFAYIYQPLWETCFCSTASVAIWMEIGLVAEADPLP